MSKIQEPPFDDAELARLLSHFEQAGPAVPEGVDDFCKAFAQWIQAGDHAEKDADDFHADLSFIRGMCDVARGDNDLRNPLAATRLLSDLLLTEVVDLTDSQAAHLVQSIKSATVDMSEAVERLVTEVRPEQ